MEFSFTAQGFDHLKLSIRSSGLLGGPVLLVNGQPVPKDKKGGRFTIARADGAPAAVQLRGSAFLVDPMPRVSIDGASVSVGQPLPWYQLVWAGLPLALIGLGGAVGAVLGIMAAVTNGQLFRRTPNPALAFGITGLVSLGAATAYVTIAGGLGVVLRALF